MLEQPTDPAQITRWQGAMPVGHRYTAGLAGETFFRALQERGVFLASVCEECDVTYCPSRSFCERCLARLEGGIEVGPRGTLESFTVVYRGLDGEALDEPELVGLVRLDGADTLLVHRVATDDDDVLEIGMRVEPVLLPPDERAGGIGDVRHFRPVPHGP